MQSLLCRLLLWTALPFTAVSSLSQNTVPTCGACADSYLRQVAGSSVIEKPASPAAAMVGSSPSWTTGPKRLLFMRLIFPDDSTVPITEAEAMDLMTLVNDWYVEKSYGAITITSDVTPLLMMPHEKIWYRFRPLRTLLDDARAAAATNGYSTNDYDLDIARFTPITGLNFSGSAVTRGKGLWLQSSHPGVVVHELGHNLGLEHANFWAAGADSIIGPGTHVEYGNVYDAMGQPPLPPDDYHFNVCWLNQLGWLGNSAVLTVNTSGVYRLHAFDVSTLASGTLYGLRIRKDQSREYWAEFREKFTGNPWTQQGILLNWSPWEHSRFGTHLLDTTPGSPAGNNSKDDAALVVGRTLSDAQAAIHITPLTVSGSETSRWIDVQINLGSFSNNVAPTLTLAADGTNVGAGEPVQFTASAGDLDGDSLTYHWDFGDLSLGSNSAAIVKAWQQPGEYAVRCTVSDMKGGVASRNIVITVGAPAAFQVAGRVTDIQGQPVEGVRIHNGGAGSAYRGVYTDSDGMYALVNLPEGSHTLFAVKYGYNLLTTGWANPVSVAPSIADRDWTASPYPPLSVIATDVSATESEAGSDTATFTITRSGSLDAPLTIKFNVEGTAELFDDYTLSAGGSTWPYTFVLPAGVAATNILLIPGDEFEREGTETVTLTLLEDVGYTISTNSATATISDSIGGILPFIQWQDPSAIVYGTPLGPQQLDAFTFDQGTLAYYPPAGTVLNAGERQLAVVFTPDDPLRYESATNYVTINVERKALTVTAEDVTVVHGAPIVLTASYDGFVNGDTAEDLDFPASITSDATPSSNIGSYPIIVSGASDANYSISFVSGNLTITRATTTGVLTSSLNPAYLGETVTFTFAVSAVAPSAAIPAGTVRFTVDGIPSSAPLVNGVAVHSADNLSVGLHSVIAEYLDNPNFFGTVRGLDPAQLIISPPVITWPAPADITYGAALGISELNASCSVPGTFTYNPPAGTVLNAGADQVLSAIFTPSDTNLYRRATNNVTINVLKKSLVITANNRSKVYGASLPFLSLTYNGFVNGDTVGRLDTPAIATTVATAASAVGDYPINVSGASDSNYDISFVSGTLTITPAALTITAIDQSKVYGAGISGLVLGYTGFVNGDTPASLDTPPVIITDATAASPVGTYLMTAGGAADSNYTITFAGGTLTITPASTLGIVASSSNPALPGELVTFTFTANAVAPSAATPDGSVLVKVDGVSASTPLVNGVATFSTSTLSVGPHVVEVEYAGNANWIGTTNRLSPNQLVNTLPVAGLDQMECRPASVAQVLISTLLANDVDPDGDTVTFVSVGATSANGAVVTRQGDWIRFAAPAVFTNDDSFTYRISDGRGQPVVGVVNVRVNTDPVPSPNLAITPLGNGSFRISFDGLRDVTYQVEFSSSDLSAWQILGTVTANEIGSFEIIDAPPAASQQRFYRAVYP